ncbi:unnamed protein product [Calicophoron daubneyi]|uniref:Mitochondrial ribosomal protein L32 n=1 Tax=Calicophoron daubneyi TaxID=300641 RepID=A0AAV2TI81_CALDB
MSVIFRLFFKDLDLKILLLRSLWRPDSLAPAIYTGTITSGGSWLEDAWSALTEGFYFATPKKRRSLEIRRTRKFRSFTMDKYRLRDDLTSCVVCGYTHPRGHLCVNCYDEVRSETSALRSQIGSQLPSDYEVRFIYRDDPKESAPEAATQSGIKPVYVDRQRPSWFPLASVLRRKHSQGDES